MSTSTLVASKCCKANVSMTNMISGLFSKIISVKYLWKQFTVYLKRYKGKTAVIRAEEECKKCTHILAELVARESRSKINYQERGNIISGYPLS